MCGITGFVDFHESRSNEILEKTLLSMTHAISHRGPDWEGIWTDVTSGVGLGFRRLAILDLSETGKQPMPSACGRYVMVFNGELYNYKILKNEMISGSNFSFPFRGTSDTEVLLAAFTVWGIEEALKKANGMFAFGVWDRELRTLTLARDRLGEKPLYYGYSNDLFLFGSELKALKAHPRFKGQIDRDVLSLYMRSGYIPAPHSIYQGIQKLPPASFVTFSVKTKSLSPVMAYWSAREVSEAGVRSPFQGSEDEAVRELEKLLKDSVSLRMASDVPLGAFLSGGIDSSTTVALMQSLSHKPIQTFTIGFSEDRYNESEHARQVAKHLKTEHYETVVTAKDALEVIPLLPTLYDEPFADSSQIPTYLVSKIARTKVTVALSGDGGDELFGGYNRHTWGKVAWKLTHRVPGPIKNMLSSGLDALSPATWNSIFKNLAPFLPSKFCWVNSGEKFQRLSDVLQAKGPEAIYESLVTQWKERSKLVPQSVEPVSLLTDATQWPNFKDFSLRMMYLDLVTYLPDDILTKVDRASMAVNLEVRVPFLDPRVVAFAWSLPLEMKIQSGVTKSILRKLLYQYIPRELIERPKMGFSVPIDEWLRGPLKEWAADLLDPVAMKQQGYLDPGQIADKWNEHLSGKRDWQHALWNVLQFQAWLAQGYRT